MDRTDTGKRIVSDIEVLLRKDSFVSTNFRIEHSGEWKEGIVDEYHERLVLYPEDNWIDTCGNGFSIEYFYTGEDLPLLVFGVRSPYTAPRNMEFSEELVTIMESNLKSRRIAYETLASSDELDTHWRIWSVLSPVETEDFNVADSVSMFLKVIGEVFVEREKLVRPDYLIF